MGGPVVYLSGWDRTPADNMHRGDIQDPRRGEGGSLDVYGRIKQNAVFNGAPDVTVHDRERLSSVAVGPQRTWPPPADPKVSGR